MIEGELYKHGVCAPLLKCLSRAEGIELMVGSDQTCNPLISREQCLAYFLDFGGDQVRRVSFEIGRASCRERVSSPV